MCKDRAIRWTEALGKLHWHGKKPAVCMEGAVFVMSARTYLLTKASAC